MRPFYLMIKPVGPQCNLSCSYCYYLPKRSLYSSKETYMTGDLLEEAIKGYINCQEGPEIWIGFQGGEPTLYGISFYEEATALVKKYLPSGWRAHFGFQTNGLLLTSQWATFFRENQFLVGLSMDGPAWLHDKYRVDREGLPTHYQALSALNLLLQEKVLVNILCVVNNENGEYPLEVYQFFKESGASHIQLIPLVENIGGGKVSSRSIPSKTFGRFLISIFNQWIKGDLGTIFLSIFEETLRCFKTGSSSLCLFSPTCGLAPVLEHNGDLYACDHFVYPEYLLGNIKERSMEELMKGEFQVRFGKKKQELLAKECTACQYISLCYGECPKNRIGKERTNYLCLGYQAFFRYSSPFMESICNNLNLSVSLEVIMEDLQTISLDILKRMGRNDPCFCGSGKKYKKCCLSS